MGNKCFLKFIFILIFFSKNIFSETEHRIITLSHFSTALLLQLDQEDKLIGEAWSSSVEFPEEIKFKLKTIPHLSDKIPTKEKIYSLSPNLLIGWKSAFNKINLGPIEELKANGIETFYFESSTEDGNLDLFFKDLRNLGKLLNISDKIEEEILKINSEIESIKILEKRENVLVLSNIDSNLSTIGGKGLVNSLIEKAGYNNVFKNINKSYFNSSWEDIVAQKIDIIIILASSEKDFRNKYNKIISTGYLNNQRAILNNEVYYLNYLFTTPNLDIGKTIKALNQKKLLK